MTGTKIDFAKLNLKDALDLAILIEEEAKDRYTEFVDQMVLHHTPEAANFFRHMADNEAKHEASLSTWRDSLYHNAPRTVKRSMIWDVEAPDYDKTRAFMSARQAMNVALDCEIKAHDFFAAALPYLEDAEVKQLFEELRNEELLHQALVRTEISKLPADPDVDPEAFADEPTAQ
jgi:erythrin-vacuolar iron transport family protein